MMLPSATRCQRNAESMHAAGGMERERKRKLLLRRVKSVNQHPQSREREEREKESCGGDVAEPSSTNQPTDEQEAPNSDRRFIPGMCFKTFCRAPYQTLDEGHMATPTVCPPRPTPYREGCSKQFAVFLFKLQTVVR